MTTKAKEFIVYVSENNEAQEKLGERLGGRSFNTKALGAEEFNALIKDTLLPFAEEHGFKLTAEDFEPEKNKSRELDFDELDAVAGGSSCSWFSGVDCLAVFGNGGGASCLAVVIGISA